MSTKNKLNKEKISATIVAEYSGILPPPNILEGFEKIEKGSADRIIKMAEAQVLTRIKMEEKEQDSIIKCREKELNINFYEKNLSMFLAFILMLILIIGGFYLILNDKNLGGYTSIGTAILGVIGSFIYAQKQNNKK